MRPLIKCGLAPLVGAEPRILILGSLPGDVSLRQQQYYAHPQNQFWRMLSAVYGEVISSDYAERLALLERLKIAVWDVLQSAEREGSLDTAIKSAVPNGFGPFFAALPSIQAIAFNGQKAQALFHKYVANETAEVFRHMRIAVLPSTSPAATRSFEEKAKLWRAFLVANDLPLTPSVRG